MLSAVYTLDCPEYFYIEIIISGCDVDVFSLERKGGREWGCAASGVRRAASLCCEMTVRDHGRYSPVNTTGKLAAASLSFLPHDRRSELARGGARPLSRAQLGRQEIIILTTLLSLSLIWDYHTRHLGYTRVTITRIVSGLFSVPGQGFIGNSGDLHSSFLLSFSTLPPSLHIWWFEPCPTSPSQCV